MASLVARGRGIEIQESVEGLEDLARTLHQFLLQGLGGGELRGVAQIVKVLAHAFEFRAGLVMGAVSFEFLAPLGRRCAGSDIPPIAQEGPPGLFKFGGGLPGAFMGGRLVEMAFKPVKRGAMLRAESAGVPGDPGRDEPEQSREHQGMG